jgi:hypothetical protein
LDIPCPGAPASTATGSTWEFRNEHCPEQLTLADAETVTFEADIQLIESEAGYDFRGPYVQGKRGDRFIYLNWGELWPDGRHEMFRRAKLMLNVVPMEMLRAAADGAGLQASLALTDEKGGPVCAAVRPPRIVWSALTAPVD